MLNRIACYFGLSSDEASAVSNENDVSPSFMTVEAEDQWTLVDVKSKQNEGKSELNDYPTPPPSPKLEQSWLLTPPPCFDAVSSPHVEELSPRENLLIEHPSMFVQPAENTPADEEKKSVTPQAQQHKKVATVSRSQRRAARQALHAISQQSKRTYQFKKTGSDVVRRNNKAFKNMKQKVQQPRKHN